MRQWNAEGKLNAAQKLWFAATKPVEELYDTLSDPHEINNLVGTPNTTEKLNELRAALFAWQKKAGDLGQFPEPELIQRGLIADSLSQYEERRQPGFRAK